MKAIYFLRYKFIIEKLQRSKYASYLEIETNLYEKFNILGYDFKVVSYKLCKVDFPVLNQTLEYNNMQVPEYDKFDTYKIY